MQLHIWLGGVALASVVAAGAAAPSHAWHRPSAATERKIWRQYPADPNCTYPRKAMRVSDAHPRRARWAAVNLNKRYGMRQRGASLQVSPWFWPLGDGGQFRLRLRGSG